MTVSSLPDPSAQPSQSEEVGPAAGTVGHLRGAGVDVDVRRVGRIALALVAVGLAVVTAVLFVAGAQKNAQINRLVHDGVGVEVTVTACQGAISGSGANFAGYACRGTFVLDGSRHDEAIPGNVLYPPGTKVAAVAVPGDPALIDTARTVAHERASAGVFVLPFILAGALVVFLTLLVRRRRRPRLRPAPPRPGG